MAAEEQELWFVVVIAVNLAHGITSGCWAERLKAAPWIPILLARRGRCAAAAGHRAATDAHCRKRKRTSGVPNAETSVKRQTAPRKIISSYLKHFN